MPYAFIQDVPSNEQIYGKVRARLPVDPEGLHVHLAIKHERGLRYVDVWEDEAAWVAFRDECLLPTLDEVLASYGIPHDRSLVSFEPVDVIDVWTGNVRGRPARFGSGGRGRGPKPRLAR